MRFFGFDNDEDDYDDNEDYTQEREKRKKINRSSSRPSSGSYSGGKLVVYNYNKMTLNSDKIYLRDEFDKGAMILVNVNGLTPREYEEDGKDFITFMGGIAFGRGGLMTFIEPAFYLFTPATGMSEIFPKESAEE